MHKIHYDSLLSEFKNKAELLQKALSSTKEDNATAMQYFHQFERFSNLSAQEILQQFKPKSKDILELLAFELHHSSFNDLKKTIKDPFFSLQKDSFHHLWFDKYSEALCYLNQRGGFLLPHNKRYFLCQKDYIHAIGLSEKDNAWQKIKYNWVYPVDSKAHFKLFCQLLQAQHPQ